MNFDLDVLQARWCSLKSRVHVWWFWWAHGWPFKRRCPNCAGDGTESTETMDRYGDDPYVCSFCRGTGKIRRYQ